MVLTNIQAKDSLLLIIDIQERLSPMISDIQNLLKNTLKLAQASCVHDIPTLILEQYVHGLGETDKKIKSVLPRATFFSKVHFSACEEAGFLEKLTSFNKKTIVVAGTEAHVCVLQTCIDLLKSGFEVVLVTDAIGSRNSEHKSIAIEQLKHGGAVISCAEIVIFQWTKAAATPTFKKILPIIK
ncbi:isochorismatase family protein [Pseudoalteromonas sp. CR1]|uniref:isochorismatase family protein n=1 Tax=Pseudoalteromonas sp. CR1 TaxID=2861964 RepID=UPI001C5EC394|nr:isochorismatase family protein [Pseudoalteromonas sp. CR1]MBW4965864.1 isochorismatase family protein [Pseudoalteromonas sp. CR1]